MDTPSSPFRLLGVLAVVALVATAGCLSGPLGAETTDATETTDTTATETTATTVETSEPTTEPTSKTGSSTDDPGPSGIDVRRVDDADAPDLAPSLPDPVACGEHGWVSFWGTGDTDTLWQEPGELRTGWTVPANQSILFVAFENATAVGADHVEYDQPVTADGDAVAVNATSGEGLYAVVMMQDVNGNGEYDPDTDRPCKDDSDDADAGAIVMSDWLWVDWDGNDESPKR